MSTEFKIGDRVRDVITKAEGKIVQIRKPVDEPPTAVLTLDAYPGTKQWVRFSEIEVLP